MKNCCQYRHEMELLPSLEHNDPAFASLKTHLNDCPECLENFLASKIFDNHILDSMENIEVPVLLFQKIRASLGTE